MAAVRATATVCVLAAAMTLAACGDDDAPQPAATPTVTQKPSPTTTPAKKAQVKIKTPPFGAKVRGKPIGSHGERIAYVKVTGTATPGAPVYVSGNGDGGRERDDSSLTAPANGKWKTRVNVIGCGEETEEFIEISASIEESFGNEDRTEVEFNCEKKPAPAPAETTPAPSTPPQGSCSEIPARNFPVPPGDSRDADGDGIACETE